MEEEELNLWDRCRQGDEAAREELVLFYLPLVTFWVKKIGRIASWASRDDLMQDGVIGLIKAVKKYDPRMGYKFTTYARHYIREAIYDSAELTRNLSRRQDENYRKIKGKHDELAQKLGRKPTIEEIGREVGLAADQVRSALDAICIAFAEGLPESSDASRAGTDRISARENMILIRDALSRLSKREVLIVTSHYWDDRSHAEIAEELGLTTSNVSKICQRAIKKLRTIYGVK